MTAHVSIIMPAYNAATHIGAALESVQGQTYQNWELIVVDDGSRDGTGECVRKVAASEPRIQYLHRENGGQSKARNAGIRATHGSLIAFLDADDLWLPEKLARQVEVLDREQADVVFSDAFLFGTDATDVSARFGTITGRYAGDVMFDLLWLQNRIPILTVVARRARLEQVGLFDETFPRPNYHEDHDLWLRLAKAGAVFYGLPDALARYRRHGGAVTAWEQSPAMLAAEIGVLERHRSGVTLSDEAITEKLGQLQEELILALVQAGRGRDALDRCAALSQHLDGDRIVRIRLHLLRWALDRGDWLMAMRQFGRVLARAPRQALSQDRPLLARLLLGPRLGGQLYAAHMRSRQRQQGPRRSYPRH